MEHATQERLDLDVPSKDDWRLDARTREVGRQGLAHARAALAEATRRLEAREQHRANRTAERHAA